MKYLLGFFVAVVFLVGFPEKALACSCVGMTVKEAVASSDAVFIGQVVKAEKIGEDSHGEHFKVTLQVSGYWKGSIQKTITLDSFRPLNSCADLWRIRIGETYVVYAKEGGFTTVCSRTRPLSKAVDDVRELGKSKVVLQ